MPLAIAREGAFVPVMYGIYGAKARYADQTLSVSLTDGLREYPLVDQSGAALGTLYGLVLEGALGDGLTMRDGAVVFDGVAASIGDFETRILPDIQGNFFVWTHGALPSRVYLNEGGTIPLVYCAASGRIASSAGLMFDAREYEERLDRARYERLVANEIEGAWVPLHLNCHAGLKRLVPHHYLDLETWEQVRFWPRVGDVALDTPLDEAAQTCLSAMAGFIAAAVCQVGRVSPTLTAGFDSRILLVTSKQSIDQLDFFTFGRDPFHVDYALPKEMVEALGLSHAFLGEQRASHEQMEQWDRAVGHSVRETNRENHPALEQVTNRFIMTGLYGENGRSRMYASDLDTINTKPASVDMVVGRLGLPRAPEVLGAVEDWLAGIARLPTSCILDLAFHEIKFGTWAMAQVPAQHAIRPALLPFAQRSVQRAFMTTDPRIKREEALFRRIGELGWPEAMEHKVNTFGDYRDVLFKLRKLTSRAHITRLLRKLS
ncbi:MAG: hypothetical protein AAF291_02360 [Pseudomonadota bacterium]